MEKSLNVVEKISDQLYVITETESVHCYLVIGSDKAMLFDIGYGYENIIPLVRTITDLPVMLVLSHGDPDHGLGSKWFDEVWIHPLDWGKLLWNDTTEMRKKAMDYRVNKMPWTKELIPEEFPEWRISSKTKPHFLCHGDKISLGDIEFTVLHRRDIAMDILCFWKRRKNGSFPETRYLHTTSGIFREMMCRLPSGVHFTA